jgi:spore germination protein GerM
VSVRRVVIVTLGIVVLGWAALRFFHREAPVPVVSGIDSTSTGVHSVQLWFAAPAGDGLVSEPRDVVDPGSELHERVAVLIAELERGPEKGGVKTLPAGTALLHVYLDDRGLLTLDLSRAFQQNFRGGTADENLVIGSLVRTLAGSFPEVRQIQVVCGGLPLSSLGGHLPLDRPLDVGDWP